MSESNEIGFMFEIDRRIFDKYRSAYETAKAEVKRHEALPYRQETPYKAMTLEHIQAIGVLTYTKEELWRFVCQYLEIDP